MANLPNIWMISGDNGDVSVSPHRFLHDDCKGSGRMEVVELLHSELTNSVVRG